MERQDEHVHARLRVNVVYHGAVLRRQQHAVGRRVGRESESLKSIEALVPRRPAGRYKRRQLPALPVAIPIDLSGARELRGALRSRSLS